MRTASRWAICSLLLLLAAGDADAWWFRQEWLGFEGRSNSQVLRFVDLGLYQSRYGLGVGTDLFDGTFGAWDLPRHGKPDASGHMIRSFGPLKGYAALYSWKGPPFVWGDGSGADHSIGKIEAYGSYTNWARMLSFNEDTGATDILGKPTRTQLKGTSSKVKVIDYGLRLDQHLGAGFSVTLSAGREEVWSRDSSVFRPKYFSRWYGAASLFFGYTAGSDYSGGIYRVFTDSWNGLRALFGGSTVRRKAL